MSSNRAMARHNPWYCYHKAPLLRLSIKPWFDRDQRSDWMSKSASISCPPNMLPLFYHCLSSQYHVVIGYRQLAACLVNCLSGQPICNLVTLYCFQMGLVIYFSKGLTGVLFILKCKMKNKDKHSHLSHSQSPFTLTVTFHNHSHHSYSLTVTFHNHSHH
jgi:hypothetical protein